MNSPEEDAEGSKNIGRRRKIALGGIAVASALGAGVSATFLYEQLAQKNTTAVTAVDSSRGEPEIDVAKIQYEICDDIRRASMPKISPEPMSEKQFELFLDDLREEYLRNIPALKPTSILDFMTCRGWTFDQMKNALRKALMKGSIRAVNFAENLVREMLVPFPVILPYEWSIDREMSQLVESPFNDPFASLDWIGSTYLLVFPDHHEIEKFLEEDVEVPSEIYWSNQDAKTIFLKYKAVKKASQEHLDYEISELAQSFFNFFFSIKRSKNTEAALEILCNVLGFNKGQLLEEVDGLISYGYEKLGGASYYKGPYFKAIFRRDVLDDWRDIIEAMKHRGVFVE